MSMAPVLSVEKLAWRVGRYQGAYFYRGTSSPYYHIVCMYLYIQEGRQNKKKIERERHTHRCARINRERRVFTVDENLLQTVPTRDLSFEREKNI